LDLKTECKDKIVFGDFLRKRGTNTLDWGNYNKAVSWWWRVCYHRSI